MRPVKNKFWQTVFLPYRLQQRQYVERIGRDVVSMQEEALARALAVVHGSDLAHHLHLRSGMRVNDLRTHVPILSYDDMEPFIRRLKNGRQQAMFNQYIQLKMFAMSSGTTGNRKYIPITDVGTELLQQSWHYWGISAIYEHPQIIGSRFMRLTSDSQQTHTLFGVPCGDISGYLAQLQPWYIRAAFQPHRLIEKIVDQPAKYYLCLLLTIADRDVRFISTATPNTLIRMAEWGETWKESLIADLFNGTLADWVQDSIPSPIKASILHLLRARRARARELDQIATRESEFIPRHYWPHLGLLATWTGGSFRAYMPRVRELYGNVPTRDIGLTASEGVVTIPMVDGVSAGVLNTAANFYEFQSLTDQRPVTYLAHELELGKTYSTIITTPNGLIRYALQDLVKVEGFVGQAPLLSFVGRAQNCSDLTGEKLTPQHVARSIAALQNELGVVLGAHTLVPEIGRAPGYCLYVEESDTHIDHLAQILDEQLQQHNFIYQEHRQAAKLSPVRVVYVPKGSFLKLEERKLARAGASLAQFKPPCLVNDPDYGERLTRRLKSAGF